MKHDDKIQSLPYLLACLGVVLLVALWLFGAQWFALRQQLNNAQTRLHDLHAQISEFEALEGSQRINWQVIKSDRHLLRGWLKSTQANTLESIGVSIESSSNESNEGNGIELVVTRAKFTSLAKWLLDTEASSNIRVAKIDFQKTGETGKVSGIVRLSLIPLMDINDE